MQQYGRGIGGVVRRCRLAAGHTGRHTDMPFLEHLKGRQPKVAEKIERDSFQTRGASWGTNEEGEQARRNRQPRWTLRPGDGFYPAHYQEYEVCLQIAAELTLQAYEMSGAPACPTAVAACLPRPPVANSAVCPICRLPLEFAEFSLAVQSKAAIDTDHLNPQLERRHVPGNVRFVHHQCNTTKGDRSPEEFVGWMRGVLERLGFNSTEPPNGADPTHQSS